MSAGSILFSKAPVINVQCCGKHLTHAACSVPAQPCPLSPALPASLIHATCQICALLPLRVLWSALAHPFNGILLFLAATSLLTKAGRSAAPSAVAAAAAGRAAAAVASSTGGAVRCRAVACKPHAGQL